MHLPLGSLLSDEFIIVIIILCIYNIYTKYTNAYLGIYTNTIVYYRRRIYILDTDDDCDDDDDERHRPIYIETVLFSCRRYG